MAAEKKLNLEEKIVEIRKACPYLQKKKSSVAIRYKFASIYDIYEIITPVLNEYLVNFDVINEENANVCATEMKTGRGGRQMFLYNSDLTCRWTNAEDPTEYKEIKVHATAWNDDPAKAKGSAWTYALKYYFFAALSLDQGDEDPDAMDFREKDTAITNGQIQELYAKAEKCGMDKRNMDTSVKARYGKTIRNLSNSEYEELREGFNKCIQAQQQKKAQPGKEKPAEERTEIRQGG